MRNANYSDYSTSWGWLLFAFSLMLIIVGCATTQPESAEVESPATEKPAVETPAPSPWPEGKLAAVSVTFDDGTLDQLEVAAPILDEFGVKGTFFVISGTVEPGIWDDNGTIRTIMGWNDIKTLSRKGHEIGSHSYSHADMMESWRSGVFGDIAQVELELSREMIKDEIRKEVDSFAWPYWRTLPEVTEEGLQYYKFIKGGVVSPSSYYANYGNDPLIPGERGSLLSFSVMPYHTEADLTRMANWIKKKNGWWILAFHGINGSTDRKGTGWSPLPEEKFRGIISSIASDEELWLAPMNEIYDYVEKIKAR